MRHPIFFFARELVAGRVPGLEAYKVNRPIVFGHDVEPADFPMTEAVFSAFKGYVAKDPNWKSLVLQLDRERSFIETEMRFDLATASYGGVAALQVMTKEDAQVVKAVEGTVRARDLAMAAMRVRMQKP